MSGWGKWDQKKLAYLLMAYLWGSVAGGGLVWDDSAWSQFGTSSPLFSNLKSILSFLYHLCYKTYWSIYIVWFLINLTCKNFCVHFCSNVFKRWLLHYLLLHREPNRNNKLVSVMVEFFYGESWSKFGEINRIMA